MIDNAAYNVVYNSRLLIYITLFNETYDIFHGFNASPTWTVVFFWDWIGVSGCMTAMNHPKWDLQSKLASWWYPTSLENLQRKIMFVHGWCSWEVAISPFSPVIEVKHTVYQTQLATWHLGLTGNRSMMSMFGSPHSPLLNNMSFKRGNGLKKLPSGNLT